MSVTFSMGSSLCTHWRVGNPPPVYISVKLNIKWMPIIFEACLDHLPDWSLFISSTDNPRRYSERKHSTKKSLLWPFLGPVVRRRKERSGLLGNSLARRRWQSSELLKTLSINYHWYNKFRKAVIVNKNSLIWMCNSTNYFCVKKCTQWLVQLELCSEKLSVESFKIFTLNFCEFLRKSTQKIG